MSEISSINICICFEHQSLISNTLKLQWKPSSKGIQSQCISEKKKKAQTFCPLDPGAPSSPERPFFPCRVKQVKSRVYSFHLLSLAFSWTCRKMLFPLKNNCFRILEGWQAWCLRVWFILENVVADIWRHRWTWGVLLMGAGWRGAG